MKIHSKNFLELVEWIQYVSSLWINLNICTRYYYYYYYRGVNGENERGESSKKYLFLVHFGTIAVSRWKFRMETRSKRSLCPTVGRALRAPIVARLRLNGPQLVIFRSSISCGHSLFTISITRRITSAGQIPPYFRKRVNRKD